MRGIRASNCLLAIGLLLAGTPAAAQDAQTARLTREIDALDAEVTRLESTRAIKKLQRAYGYYVDRGLWDEAADLFAADATLEYGMDGVYVGKARIRDYLMRQGGGRPGLSYGQLNEHLQLQPLVTLAPDGRSAKARWRDLAMLGHFGKDAAWGDGIFENVYVLDQGVWKIAALHLYVTFVAPYESGWARLQPVKGDWRSETARAFPPDRPPTRRYAPFPDPFVPPFHYPHPVTGQTYREDRP